MLQSKMVISAHFALQCENKNFKRRKSEMESQVWVKVSLFLKELRCEDIKRNSIIHLESCQKEKKALKIFRQVWEKEQKNLSELQQRTICNYIEQIQAVSFEEQQEAYCQGIIDCVQILSGWGLLESDEKIKRAIEKLK